MNNNKDQIKYIRDATEANKEEVNQLLEETKELGNILGASLLTLKGRKKF